MKVGGGLTTGIVIGAEYEAIIGGIYKIFNIKQPLNPNGNFSEGEIYWDASSPSLQTSQWGYKITKQEWWKFWNNNQFGQIWIYNPLVDRIHEEKANDHVALMQTLKTVKDYGVTQSDLMLKDKRFVLDADIRMDEDIQYAPDGFSRAAIAFAIAKPDNSPYLTDNKSRGLYAEYDFYRRNFSTVGGLPKNYFECPVDQIQIGEWKHYTIDVKNFLTNGWNGLGGWRKDIYDESLLSAWYLVVEVQGSKAGASWRNIKLNSV